MKHRRTGERTREVAEAVAKIGSRPRLLTRYWASNPVIAIQRERAADGLIQGRRIGSGGVLDVGEELGDATGLVRDGIDGEGDGTRDLEVREAVTSAD